VSGPCSSRTASRPASRRVHTTLAYCFGPALLDCSLTTTGNPLTQGSVCRWLMLLAPLLANALTTLACIDIIVTRETAAPLSASSGSSAVSWARSIALGGQAMTRHLAWVRIGVSLLRDYFRAHSYGAFFLSCGSRGLTAFTSAALARSKIGFLLFLVRIVEVPTVPIQRWCRKQKVGIVTE
jgi:hypothetical protein